MPYVDVPRYWTSVGQMGRVIMVATCRYVPHTKPRNSDIEVDFELLCCVPIHPVLGGIWDNNNLPRIGKFRQKQFSLRIHCREEGRTTSAAPFVVNEESIAVCC